jgi:ketosteroid isomerase-like protein
VIATVGCMTALTEYIRAWVANDVDRIAAVVTEECVITECYGPVYRGRDWVRRWAEAWFGAGGIVHRWDFTDHIVTRDREIAEWTFECTWGGDRSTFDGATVARVGDDLIAELREYQTSAPLYDWHGTWH